MKTALLYPTPIFRVVLHCLKGRLQDAIRLVTLHGACVVSHPTRAIGLAERGCEAFEVSVRASYAVIQRLQDTLGLDVLCWKTGRFQVGLFADRSTRVDAVVLDALRYPLPLPGARAAKAPRRPQWKAA